MPKAGKPRVVTLNGVQVVVLTPEQYDGLEATRRQLGGLRTQVSRMKQELRRGRDLLSEAEHLLASLPPDLLEGTEGGTAPGRGVPQLLTAIRAALPPDPAPATGSASPER
ncbi:hypothetical protein ACIQ9P_07660 [Kitasatospora sp. NPDC094019]|uniref:hypothetical protein n=1 Tax=Kitasatospora sp. NPDC094019 TaxID=3364091 RepID=UPI003828A2DC